MKHQFILIFSLVMLTVNTSAQNDHDHDQDHHHHPHLQVGLQAQQYPTGFIFTLAADKIWDHKNLLEVRVGYNTFDHKDMGEQLMEEGDGFGGSVGYKRYLNEELTQWLFGFRTDIWFNEVEYLVPTTIPETPFVMQKSEIVVIQPTLLAGYTIPLNDVLVVTPEVAFGVEWNVDTDGAPTGEGHILLWGVTIVHRIGK